MTAAEQSPRIVPMPPVPESDQLWWTVKCYECGTEEGMSKERDDKMLMNLQENHRHNAAEQSPADEWCMDEKCDFRNWRSGSMPTHKRGSSCAAEQSPTDLAAAIRESLSLIGDGDWTPQDTLLQQAAEALERT